MPSGVPRGAKAAAKKRPPQATQSLADATSLVIATGAMARDSTKPYNDYFV
jgi:hypothetical protein